MHLEDTPPASPEIDDDADVDEDDMVYIGDVDEVIEQLEAEEADDDDEADDEGMEEDEEDHAATVFIKHTGSVFCGSLSKDGKLAATGGEDDKAYIWNTATGEVIHECTGHQDSVIFADFNHDDSYIATGDMSGIIQVWKMSNKERIWDFNTGDATWMKWHKQANVLFAGCVEGEIYMWKIPTGECKIFQSFGQRSENAALASDGKKLVAGYGDGTIRIWDLKEGTVHATIPTFMGHNESITALDCQPDGQVIISSAVDGKTILSTTQTGKVIGTIQHLEGHNNTDNNETIDEETKHNWVEAVSFCNDLEMHMVATGTLSGEIFIWDTVKQIIRNEIKQESGISKLAWKANTPFLFSAGLDGGLRLYDARNGQCIKSFWGHYEDILDLNVSKDGKTVLTTSDDKTARIFDMSNI